MIQRNAILAYAFFWAATTLAQESSPSNVLTIPLDNYIISGLPEQNAQITEAIANSPVLATQLHELAASELLSSITVVQDAAPASSRPTFQGLTEGRNIVLTSRLLTELRRRRLFDVVFPDDVLPNQTVFVLAHLAQHLRTASAMQVALKTAPSPDAYVRLRIRDEAVAFIVAWNATVDGATHTNGDMQLTSRQVASVFMNSRYRFAFPLLGDASKVHLSESGKLEETAQNIDAITERLKASQLADIE